MAAFKCNKCGKCCASYGDFIKIERQLTSRDYYCCYGIKNERFFAHIEGEFADKYPPDSNDGKPKKGCPFVQKNLTGEGFVCAIYATRPRICREFRCYRMVVYHRDGQECGRILGQADLKTTDETLAGIWKEEISLLPSHDNSRWEKSVIAVLAAHGYRGEAADQE